MPKKKYIVSLASEERQSLEELLSRGKHGARALTRARILLKADVNRPQGSWCDQQIADALEVGTSTIERVRQRFVEQGLEAVLTRQRGARIYQRLLDGQQEAQLIAIACGEKPVGRSRWTLRLLAEQMVALNYVETISYETVRQTLKKTTSNLGGKLAG
jgi:transposase